MRNLLLAILLSVGTFAACVASAQQFSSGEHYINLRNQVSTQSPDKVEVVEFFWYGCGYCAQLEPAINSWEKRLAADVNFVRVPAMFGGVWDLHAQMFYSLEAMGQPAGVHAAIFNALHKENLKLANLNEITSFLARHGVDKEQFTKAWNSFSVKTNMQKAKRLAIAYQVASVPTMAVNGKYRFDIGSAGGLVETTELADYLIEQERR